MTCGRTRSNGIDQCILWKHINTWSIDILWEDDEVYPDRPVQDIFSSYNGDKLWKSDKMLWISVLKMQFGSLNRSLADIGRLFTFYEGNCIIN